jgi:hypothetical protein
MIFGCFLQILSFRVRYELLSDYFKMSKTSAITHAEVLAAQKGWTDALLLISAEYHAEGYDKAKATAADIIRAAYAYKYGAVAFKPTLTEAPQTFRPDFEGALSYFVGGNTSYPKDKGFGLGSNGGAERWISTDIQNNVVQILDNDSAISMGNVFFVNSEDQVTKVDKTWGWEKYSDGSIRINLHHSSVAYLPEGSQPYVEKALPDAITGQFEMKKKGLASWAVDNISGLNPVDGLISFNKNNKMVTLYSDRNDNGKIDSFDLAVGFAEIDKSSSRLAGWTWDTASNMGEILNKNGKAIGALAFLDEGIF